MKNHYLLLIISLAFIGFVGAASAQKSEWDSNFKRVYLSQNGKNISGAYDYAGGKITAIIEGKVMKGWWSETDDSRNCGPDKKWSGPVVLNFSDDGKSFTGKYGKCSHGQMDFNSVSGNWHGHLVSGSPIINAVPRKIIVKKKVKSKSILKILPKKTVPAPVAPLPVISLKPGQSVFLPDQIITVLFSGLPAKGQDWLALSAVKHKADEYYAMAMLEGKPKSGRHNFMAVPEGKYEVRAYTNWPDGGYKVKARTEITVAKMPVAPQQPIAPVALPQPVKIQADVIAPQPKTLPLIDPPQQKIGNNTAISSDNKLAEIPPSADIPKKLIPLMYAVNAPKGLGVDIPAADSWPHQELAFKGIDEIKKLFKYDANARYKNKKQKYSYRDHNRGYHSFKKYSDKDTDRVEMEIHFSKNMVDKVAYRDDKRNKIVLSFYEESDILFLAVTYRSKNNVLNGPTYSYYKDKSPRAISEYKTNQQDDAYLDHGKKIYLDNNGFRRKEEYFDNNKHIGTWKIYKDGKLTKYVTYIEGDKHRIEVGYKKGTINSIKYHTNHDAFISISYNAKGKVHSINRKVGDKWVK